MTKKRKLEDIYYPVPKNFNLIQSGKQPINQEVIRNIVQASVKGAFQLKDPCAWDYHGNPIKPKAVATFEQIEMITHLIESLQPLDVIEVALASQFAITYIRGLHESTVGNSDDSLMLEFFEFGHRVLETLNRYRTKGAQLINVQYNHNQGQINNYRVVKQEDKPGSTIEVN